MSTTTGGVALALRGIAKSFGSTVALDGVDLVVARGSVHALLGENGAGKSTLMRIAYGLTEPDAGSIELFGVRYGTLSVPVAARGGVGMVHQHLSLVPNLSPAENVALGMRGLFRPAEVEELLSRAADAAGLSVPAARLVRELSIVEQQRLEILKALSRGARLLILDEPTAVLAPSESAQLLEWIRRFASGGGSVVLVTHKLNEALTVADEVTVLRRGRVVQRARASDASAEGLARAMFPDRTPVDVPVSRVDPTEPVVRAIALEVRDDRGVPRIHDASFVIRRHEIVGLAAVEGSGHRQLLEALAGLRAAARGQLTTAARIALIPADRARDALVADFTLTENVALHGLGRRSGLMPWRGLEAATQRLIERFRIAAPSPAAPARALSGGNQQRLVIARELHQEVDLVVADNPTRGLDVDATEFVHGQLRAAAARGAAVVVHASDVDDVLAIATRVLVVFHGSVRAVTGDRDAVGRAMLGVA